MSRIDVQGLTYSIGKKNILNGVDVSFPSQSFTGIIGPNGSGKSTLLKNIYTLVA